MPIRGSGDTLRVANIPNQVAGKLYGSVQPRRFTPPLRPLTPETSYGFAVIDFARNVLKEPLDPWQEWLVIHAGELLEDGRPRFNKVLLLVARQNGKTHLVRVLITFWAFVDEFRRIVSTSASFERALEDWDDVKALIERTPVLKKRTLGQARSPLEVVIRLKNGRYYKASAATPKKFRGKSLDRIILDEFRYTDRETWAAAVPTLQTRDYAQIWMPTNAGSDASEVLNEQHALALKYLDSQGAEGDWRLGLFEWSAKEEMAIDDTAAWAMANPNVGWRFSEDNILRPESIAAKANGAKAQADFRTEYLCQRVRTMNGAIDPTGWSECADPGKFSDDNATGRVAFCLDISFDSQHATLSAAATLSDGRTRVGIIKEWRIKGLALKIRQELPGLVAQYKPRKLGWFPYGPSANLSTWLKPQAGVRPALPGVEIVEMRDQAADACMTLAEMVDQRSIAHNAEEPLNTHVLAASKKYNGDRWVMERPRNDVHIDAAYAAAGAVYLANTMPPPSKMGLVIVSEDEID